MIRKPFDGVGEQAHRPRGLVGLRVCRGERELAAGARIGLEQRVELTDPAGAVAGRRVELRQLFAHGNGRGGERNRPFERALGLGRPLQLAQADAQQVMRLGQPAVEGDGAGQRLGRLAGLAGEHLRQSQLVEHAAASDRRA